MNNLEAVTTNDSKTMSSVEIAELAGKRHDHVMRDIKKMLETLEVNHPKFGGVYIDSKGEQRPCYKLDRYHTEVLVTGYDVKRRAAVIKRWHDLETGTSKPQATNPIVKDPGIAMMIETLTRLDAVKQEQEQQRQELAEIRAKIKASPDEYYTVAGYASLRGINIDVKRANLLGRKAAKMSKDYGIDIGKAHSSVFGQVNTYHVDVLCELFEGAK